MCDMIAPQRGISSAHTTKAGVSMPARAPAHWPQRAARDAENIAAACLRLTAGLPLEWR